MKVAHLRDVYLQVSFIHFLLRGFRKHEHYIVCREVKKNDLILFPYDKIIKTSILFLPSWLIDKILTIKLNFTFRPINDWHAYKYAIAELGHVNILHAHMGTQGYYAIPLAKKLKVPLFVTFYGVDMSKYPKIPGWKERYELLFKVAAKIVVEGKHMKSKMIALGCPEEKVIIIPIGIPIDEIKFSYRKISNPDEPLKIFMCARLDEKKGFDDALEVIHLLVNHQKVNLQCDIVGDGPLWQKLIKQTQNLGISDRVVFHGRKSLGQIYEMAKEAHVFFHPSKTSRQGDSEGGAPTIIIEMQALGLPIVSTTHADIPNIIPRGNHFLAPEGDVNLLVRQFMRLLDEKDTWNKMSKRGRIFVEENHSNVVCAKKLEAFYESE
jgi:colanic acid/amylovoran biosynthesis glycosyltransferase